MTHSAALLAQMLDEQREPLNLDDLRKRLGDDRFYDIGFPGARDITHEKIGDVLTGKLVNNYGDPFEDGHGTAHTKDYERWVVNTVADWFHAPPTRWGYVTDGASQGTTHALREARTRWPDVIVYTSSAAHDSVGKAADLLGLTQIIIRTDEIGRIDLADLAAQLTQHRKHPAAIVATVGTTMNEAVDDVAGISDICKRLAITRRRLHVDAALSGIPLALAPDPDVPAFDFAAGATSIVVSGHKFLSTLEPCAVLVYADNPYWVAGRRVYTGSSDTTISGSRSGHTVLRLFNSLTLVDAHGHKVRALKARAVARLLKQRLDIMGWEAHRAGDYAMTVVLRRPPQIVLDRWPLADDGPRVHVVCVPGVTEGQVLAFLADLLAATDTRTNTLNLPRQQGSRSNDETVRFSPLKDGKPQ